MYVLLNYSLHRDHDSIEVNRFMQLLTIKPTFTVINSLPKPLRFQILSN